MIKAYDLIKILSIAAGIVVAGIILFPVVLQGTIDPCEAVARIVATKTPKSDMPEPWGKIADELAVKVGAAYARNHGTLACYRLIPVVLKQSPNTKRITN